MRDLNVLSGDREDEASVGSRHVCDMCFWQGWLLRGKAERSHVPWLSKPLQHTSATSANTTTSTASTCIKFPFINNISVNINLGLSSHFFPSYRYFIFHKPNKTWQQVFWLTISIAINNAYILYKMSDAYTVKRYSRAQFGERLVRELLDLDDCSPTQWGGRQKECTHTTHTHTHSTHTYIHTQLYRLWSLCLCDNTEAVPTICLCGHFNVAL